MKSTLIILLFLILSCKKDKIRYNISCNSATSNIKISKELIVGKWVWVSELYREQLTGQYILKTPTSEGYIRQVNATKSCLEFSKNSSFEQKYLYDFVVESTITNYPDDTLTVLVFKDYNTGVRTNHTHFKICNDTLTLNFQVRSSFAGIQKWVKIN